MKYLRLITYIVLIGSGVGFGILVSTPGKSESHGILEDHGKCYVSPTRGTLVYFPSNKNISTEEYEALAIVRKVYPEVLIRFQ